MRSRKGGIVLDFLLSLVIGLLLAAVAWNIYASVYRISPAAERSFDKLLPEIEDIKPGELQSAPLTLDKGTGLFIFEPGKDKIYASLSYTGFPMASIYLKPADCDNTVSPCVCLLQEADEVKKQADFLGVKVLDIPHYTFTQYECKTVQRNLKAISRINEPTLRGIDQELPVGGSFILRRASAGGIEIEFRNSRLREVFIEADRKNDVTICELPDCSQDMYITS